MLKDRIFINALIVSMLFHALLVTGLPKLRDFAKAKPQKPLDVTYCPSRKAPIDSELIARKQTKRRPLPKPRKQPAVKAQKKQLAEPAVKQDVHERLELKVAGAGKEEVLIEHPAEQTPENTQVLISHRDKDLSSEPVYLNYYNAVRSKIYKRANASKPYYAMEGTVRLVFVLARNGILLRAALKTDKSTPNPILQKHALASIKSSAPFPAFHKSMKEQELTLYLTISFEK